MFMRGCNSSGRSGRRDRRGAGVILLLLLPLGVPTRPALPQATNPAVAAELRTGDEAYGRFDNLAALAAYGAALALDSSAYPALWKTTRAYVDAGHAAKGEEQKQNYRLAEGLARRCVALHPDSAESHFVLAMALGRVALQAGGKKKITLSKEIKAEAERTLALDSCHAGAMHILGRWHYELANLSWVLKSFAKMLYGGVPPGGGNEEARRWFEKALACDPRAPVHYLWLGKTLLELHEEDLARKNLEQCVHRAPVYWEDGVYKREAEKLLQSAISPAAPNP